MDPERAIDAATALRDAGRGNEAVFLLRQSVALHPRNARLWQTLGTVYRALENSKAAIEAFTRAATIDPQNARAAHGIAQATLEAGRPAIAAFDHAVSLAPNDSQLLLGRAAAQLAAGSVDKAIDALAAIVRRNPLWLEGQVTLAKLRWQMGDEAGFADGFVRALQNDRAQLPLWLGLIDILIQVEMYGAASAVIAEANRATGAVEPLLLMEAISASELGDIAAADAAFRRIANRTDVAVTERYLRHLLRTNRVEEAGVISLRALDHGSANWLWPYISLVWRLTDDPRWQWLEGDPALIGIYDLGLEQGKLDAIAHRLRRLHQAKRDPLGQSVRCGTQTDGPLFANEAKEIQEVRQAVVNSLTRHIAAIGSIDPTHPTRRHIGKPIRFAGSWSVRLTGEGHHTSHVHTQGWLSSAGYIAVSPQEEMGPQPNGWLHLGMPPAELGLNLQPYRWIEAKVGRLVLFPSTMWHGTAPIKHGERLTIAFDVAAIG